MKRWALIGLFALATASASYATCVVRHRSFAVHRPAVVVRKVVADVVAVPVATFVPVPLYTGAYVAPVAAAPVAPATPAAQPAAAPAGIQMLMNEIRGLGKSVRDELGAVRRRLDALEGKGGLPVPREAPKGGTPDPFAPKMPRADATAEHPGLAVLRSRCASCHEKAGAAEKGGGLVLLDGARLAALTDRQWARVSSVSYSGRMPPRSTGVKLTDEEVGQVVALVDEATGRK